MTRTSVSQVIALMLAALVALPGDPADAFGASPQRTAGRFESTRGSHATIGAGGPTKTRLTLTTPSDRPLDESNDAGDEVGSDLDLPPVDPEGWHPLAGPDLATWVPALRRPDADPGILCRLRC